MPIRYDEASVRGLIADRFAADMEARELRRRVAELEARNAELEEWIRAITEVAAAEAFASLER